MAIDISDISIKIKILSSDTILAQATIILFNEWEEHGWKVLKSKKIHDLYGEEVWIQAPSYKNNGTWKELVFINNPQLFQAVQNKIYYAFKYAKDKNEALSNNEISIDPTEVDRYFNEQHSLKVIIKD